MRAIRAVPLPLPLLLLLASPLVAAAGDARFEALRERAEPVTSLELFLSRYVGQCTDPFERRTCEANVASERRSVAGRMFAVRITEAATLVKAELRGDGYLILLTPFVDGGGFALTHGAPARQDPAGHPLIGFIPIQGKLPPGVMDLEFQSPFRTGAVELEIVFRPERTWKLKRKGERGFYEGVAARFLGVRVVDGRTGNEIAAKVF
jgi:hypothetical protein